MRLLLVLIATGLCAETPPAPAPSPAPKRTRAEFIAALRAAYDGKVNAAGETTEVVIDPTYGRGIWLRQGNRSQRYARPAWCPATSLRRSPARAG